MARFINRASGLKLMLVVAAGLAAAACGSIPNAPRYPIHPITNLPMPPESAPSATVPYESPPPAPAPSTEIETSPLPPPGAASPSPVTPAPAPPPAAPASMTPGAAYMIVAGDTLSGVARRFQTPVQILIDLNGLGPRDGLQVGQNIILPDSAVDTGRDPYATGSSPIGVLVADNGVTPPPPPPPSGNPAAPAASDMPVTDVPPPAPSATGVFQWPVRGEVVRRFGSAGMGQRNDGINIGAPEGEPVRAAAGGRVAYVGDDLPGLGRTVVIIHRDGWRTAYSHLGSIDVAAEANVRQGDVIGTVGTSAGDGRPSIHFETRRMDGDQPVAIDPLSVLPR